LQKVKSQLVSENEKNSFDSLLANEQAELLKISFHNGQYVLSQDGSKATFNTLDLLQKRFYLNGQLIQYKNHNDLKSNFNKATTFKKIISLVIDQAYAGFVADTKTNRLIFASIISLNNVFEDAGIVCSIKCDTMKINFQKLAQRISKYNEQCDTAKNDQEESYEKGKSINYYSTIKVLGDPSFNEGEGVNQLLTKMNQMSGKDKDVTKILDSKLKSDFTAATCEKQLAPFLGTGISNLTSYANMDRDSVDTVSIPNVCGKINALKQCLNDLYTSNKMISQTMKAKGVYAAETNYSNLETHSAIGR
jgi:hypothetical protein